MTPARTFPLDAIMDSYITTTLENGVGKIRLNRPEKRNALKRDFIEQISAAVTEFAANESLRVLIFESEGSVFCAGMDLGEMQERAKSENGKAEWQIDSEVYATLLKQVYELPVPTVVALQGPVLAGGVGLVLACDMIVADSNAFFMLPEPMRGITAAMVTPLLIHRVGAGTAAQLLLSGERVSTTRAFQLGLCFDVVTTDELERRVDALTASILTGSKSALSITKRHLARCSNSELAAQIDLSISVSAEARETADAREGLAAFLEKRKPAWQALD
jgi:methylglutaconyl-CoA hydratase